ncbi:MAG: pre-16S rRNA-processing nuclease YqgF [Gloeomargarita sp. HHBFW_bins_162]
MPVILGFDPGRDKCGVVLRSAQGEWLVHEVVPAGEALDFIQALYQQYQPDVLVMGDQTTGKQWRQKLREVLPEINLVTVDERYSTLEAQRKYWELYPAQGWRRFLPQGMRPLPRPVDDVAARILVERYCQQRG